MTRAVRTIHTNEDRDQIARWARNVEVGTVVEFRKKSRSTEQNAKLWAMLGEVAEQVVWYGQKLDADDWKDLFTAALRNARVVPGIDKGSYVPLGMRTSQMTIAEMSDLIELIHAFGADPEHPVKFKDDNSNPGPEPSSPAAGDDEAGCATTPSLSEPNDQPVPSAGIGSNVEPATTNTSPPSDVAGSPSFPKAFNFADAEIVHLKDFARKALDDASSDNDAPAKEVALERMRLNYVDVIETRDGHQALAAIFKSAGYVIGGRPVEKAREYIAREILGCRTVELEARHG